MMPSEHSSLSRDNAVALDALSAAVRAMREDVAAIRKATPDITARLAFEALRKEVSILRQMAIVESAGRAVLSAQLDEVLAWAQQQRVTAETEEANVRTG